MDVKLVLFVSVTLCSVGGERILAVLPFHGKSHFFVYEPLLLELARRGHELTVISHFPREKPVARYTDIDVRNINAAEIKLNLTEFLEYGLEPSKVVEEMMYYVKCFESILKNKQVQNLISSTIKFDLIISEIFVSDMFIGFSHRFQAPLVEMISSIVIPWASDRFGIPDNPSYIRTYINQGAGSMSFYERTWNTFEYLLTKCFYSYIITKTDDRISKQQFGKETPSVEEMMKKTSLFLVNSHFSINGARPFPPQVVEVGGIHLKSAKPLPQVCVKFLQITIVFT